ncbi:MAG: hypothetical protein KDC38_17455, partial [Planctomycetes bacterium]|nr:hypothetical protein [Planctomycetota bacterium]
QYTIQIQPTASSMFQNSATCRVVVGAGRLVNAVPHAGSDALAATVDEANDQLYVIDLDGTIHRYTKTLDPIDSTMSPFLAGSVISGATVANGELFFVDYTTNELVRTSLGTPGPIALIDAVPFFSPAGGVVGDITYDADSGTFWGVDITERVYFEFNADGSATGSTFTFADGGHGNGITAVGAGLFDIAVGAINEEIVTRVVRVDNAGAPVGFEYATQPTTLSGFLNGIAYTTAGADGDIGEYLVGNDTNTIYAITVASQGAPFIRGDANGDGTLNLIDVTYHLQVLFGASSPTPGCQDALDADDNGAVAGGDGLTDVMYTLGYLFMGGPAPSAPFPACDVDPTDDALTCTTYESCP